MIFRGSEQDICILLALIRPREVELICLWIASEGWQRKVTIFLVQKMPDDIMNRCYQHRGSPGIATVRRGGHQYAGGNGAAHQVNIGEGKNNCAIWLNDGDYALRCITLSRMSRATGGRVRAEWCTSL